MVTAALIGLAAVAVVMGVTVAVSLKVGRVAVVDVAWGLMFVAVALALAAWSPDLHSWLLAGLVTVWGGRLAWHIGRRSRGHGEDPRYAAMLGDGGFRLALRKVFLVQAVAAFVISLPIMVAGAYDVRWSWLVAVGSLVWLVGLVFESVGDAQLAAYKARPKADRPPVLDRGLWRWTRHPNYFGDACVWWGIGLAGALATGWLPGLLTVVAPIAMTYFLAFATGARLLERTMMQRPGYPEYAARTSMFVPLPPRGDRAGPPRGGRAGPTRGDRAGSHRR
jgi:steroid 5-alpha reductase family enzyme